MSLRSSIDIHEGMSVFSIDQDHEIDFSDSIASLKISSGSGGVELADGASHFIIAFGDVLRVNTGEQLEHLRPECFGVFSGPAVVEGDGRALMVSMDNYACPRLMGGPVEQEGRLRYVDGCSATILLSPPVKGEPCFNFMHLPGKIAQTMHTHDSVRIGLILSGEGICETPTKIFDFTAGTIFIIPPGTPHSFQSPNGTLRIVIFHPDSDTGPTHDDHTMLNNTLISGVSAKGLDKIRTLEI